MYELTSRLPNCSIGSLNKVTYKRQARDEEPITYCLMLRHTDATDTLAHFEMRPGAFRRISAHFLVHQ